MQVYKQGRGKPQENIVHGLPGTTGHDVMQTMHDESVWNMRKYVAFVKRNLELYDEVMEEETKTLGYKCEKSMEREILHA